MESGEAGAGPWRVPALHQSASIDGEGRIHITVANLSAEETQEIRLRVPGREKAEASLRLLAGEMGSYNSFSSPCAVCPREEALERDVQGLRFRLPPCSVAAVELR